MFLQLLQAVAPASSYGNNASTAAANAGGVVFVLLVLVAIYVVSALFLSRIFARAGSEKWLAWVPFANAWRLLEIGGYSGALIFLTFIPFVGAIVVLIISIMAVHRINAGFGKGVGWTILYFFLPIVWVIALGVSKAPWRGGDWRVRSAGVRTPQPAYPAAAAPQSADPAGQQPQPPQL